MQNVESVEGGNDEIHIGGGEGQEGSNDATRQEGSVVRRNCGVLPKHIGFVHQTNERR